jgi:hypoxanthine-DNA glycosylase
MKSSFPPVVDKNTRVLILGSLPGEESLRQQRYYAHPKNNFWPIIFGIFNQPIAEAYEAKLAFLQSKGIGLWDVIQSAERVGSLDVNIRNATANDFESLLKQYPNIKMIAFNGRKSQETFKRFVTGKQNLPADLIMEYFPSTSPSHAYVSFEQKAATWSVLKRHIEE